MAAVTELEVFTAIVAKITAAAGWFSAKPIYFGRRPPNGGDPPYTVIAVEEQEGLQDVESDGATGQVFMVEMAARTVGPDDAADANAAMSELDPAWTDAANVSGVTLANTDKGIVAVMPKSGKLRLIEPLKDGGQDQYSAVRRWEIFTGALIGA